MNEPVFIAWMFCLGSSMVKIFRHELEAPSVILRVPWFFPEKIGGGVFTRQNLGPRD